MFVVVVTQVIGYQMKNEQQQQTAMYDIRLQSLWVNHDASKVTFLNDWLQCLLSLTRSTCHSSVYTSYWMNYHERRSHVGTGDFSIISLLTNRPAHTHRCVPINIPRHTHTHTHTHTLKLAPCESFFMPYA
jgi:hypothetical protein